MTRIAPACPATIVLGKALCLFLVIVWTPLQRFILQVDGKGRLVAAALALALLCEVVNRGAHLLRDPRVKLLSLWTAWCLLNTMVFQDFGPNPLTPWELAVSVLFPWAVYLLYCKSDEREAGLYAKTFVLAVAAYLVLTLLFDERNLDNRLGLVLNANEIAYVALLGMLATGFLTTRASQRLFPLTAAVALLFSAITASKKAALSALAYIGVRLLAKELGTVRQQLVALAKVGAVVLVAVWGLLNIFDHTVLAQRVQRTIEREQQISQVEKLFEGRARFYVRGWKLFVRHPVTGVGLRNYQRLANDFHVAHSEYVVQFAECGLIGFLLFAAFHWVLLRRLVRLGAAPSPPDDDRARQLLCAYGCILLMMLGRWTYDHMPTAAFFALVAATTDRRLAREVDEGEDDDDDENEEEGDVG